VTVRAVVASKSPSSPSSSHFLTLNFNIFLIRGSVI
jgi:hypothetical protein